MQKKENYSLNEHHFFDEDVFEESKLKSSTRRTITGINAQFTWDLFNIKILIIGVTLRNGLQVLTREQMKHLTEGFYLHRSRMNEKYGDDPKYFIFTKRNSFKNEENDSENNQNKSLSLKVS